MYKPFKLDFHNIIFLVSKVKIVCISHLEQFDSRVRRTRYHMMSLVYLLLAWRDLHLPFSL